METLLHKVLEPLVLITLQFRLSPEEKDPEINYTFMVALKLPVSFISSFLS